MKDKTLKFQQCVVRLVSVQVGIPYFLDNFQIRKASKVTGIESLTFSNSTQLPRLILDNSAVIKGPRWPQTSCLS